MTVCGECKFYRPAKPEEYLTRGHGFCRWEPPASLGGSFATSHNNKIVRRDQGCSAGVQMEKEGVVEAPPIVRLTPDKLMRVFEAIIALHAALGRDISMMNITVDRLVEAAELVGVTIIVTGAEE